MSQYSKQVIHNMLRAKATAKGFMVKPPKGQGTGINNTTPTADDMLGAIADTMSTVLSNGSLPANLSSPTINIGPPGLQQPVATKAPPGVPNVTADMTTDPAFFTWIETFHSLLNATYPEPGNGSPNVFATALKSVISLKPTSIKAKISQGSSTVKVSV